MEVMEHLIKTGESNFVYDGSENDESVANILERYDDICMLFPDDLKSPSIFPLFVEWLVNNIVLVEIKTFTVDNAYLIFETMNDRGLSLNPSEIIKAFLMSKIDDEEKAEDCNVFWKERMAEVKACAGDEGDMSFFRAWLRAKYAVTKKNKTSGSSMEDYEMIGNQFHSWMKNHLSVLKLSAAQDYYFFIKSDFDFYSRLYMQIIEYRTKSNARDPMFNIVSNYCIADSLYMPLMMASVQKSDNQVTIDHKLEAVNRFVDRFINIRTLTRKSVTQTSIRDYIFEIVKEIRNKDEDQVFSILEMKINSSEIVPYSFMGDSLLVIFITFLHASTITKVLGGWIISAIIFVQEREGRMLSIRLYTKKTMQMKGMAKLHTHITKCPTTALSDAMKSIISTNWMLKREYYVCRKKAI